MSVIADFVGTVAGFTALGAFVDQVFVDEQQRSVIRNYITARNTARTLPAELVAFIHVLNGIIFGRFFVGSVFGAKFISGCAIASIIFLVFIFSYQVGFFGPGDLKSLTVGPWQITIFIRQLSP